MTLKWRYRNVAVQTQRRQRSAPCSGGVRSSSEHVIFMNKWKHQVEAGKKEKHFWGRKRRNRVL